MIKITFKDGVLNELTSENPREIAEFLSSMKMTKETSVIAEATEKKVRGRSRAKRQGWWNIDEVRYIVANKDSMAPSKLATSPYLMQRHVPAAVRGVLANIRKGEKFSSSRLARLYHEAKAEVAPMVVGADTSQLG